MLLHENHLGALTGVVDSPAACDRTWVRLDTGGMIVVENSQLTTVSTSTRDFLVSLNTNPSRLTNYRR